MDETNWEWVNIDSIKVDDDNPNVMSNDMKESLKSNLVKYGFNMPIITDMQLLLADGEQKLIVAKELGLKRVPVLRKRLTDKDRRILRQSMNKIRGRHDIDKDAAEFEKILNSVDSVIGMDELSSLIGSSEQEILNIMDQSINDKPDNVDQVQKTGSLVLTCPKCKNQFKKEDSE